jgi:hypothetical protein
LNAACGSASAVFRICGLLLTWRMCGHAWDGVAETVEEPSDKLF